MPGPGQRMFQRTDNQSAHQSGIAEADLGLAGMDVDINIARGQFKEQGQ